MTIERDGKKIELTEMELRNACDEWKFQCELDFVTSRLDDADIEYTKEEAERLANDIRNYLDFKYEGIGEVENQLIDEFIDSKEK